MKEKYLELCERHLKVMQNKNIIISIYTNASGYLWSMCKVDSGTDLGWCDHKGDCEMSGAYKTYNGALEHALDLIDKADLNKFRKDVKTNFHWGNYTDYLLKL